MHSTILLVVLLLSLNSLWIYPALLAKKAETPMFLLNGDTAREVMGHTMVEAFLLALTPIIGWLIVVAKTGFFENGFVFKVE